MKSKLSRILKDLRAQRESIYGRRFGIRTDTRFDAVGQTNLAQRHAF
jgi:hypothetical protein